MTSLEVVEKSAEIGKNPPKTKVPKKYKKTTQNRNPQLQDDSTFNTYTKEHRLVLFFSLKRRGDNNRGIDLKELI